MVEARATEQSFVILAEGGDPWPTEERSTWASNIVSCEATVWNSILSRGFPLSRE